MAVCQPMWALRDQSIHDCAHAGGHGFFYYFQDIGLALRACWSDRIMHYARDWLSAETLLVWRWGETLEPRCYTMILARRNAMRDWPYSCGADAG